MYSKIFFSDVRSHIVSHLKSAEYSLKVAVSWLTDRELFALLLAKLKDGVSVSLVTRNDYLNNHPDALPWNEFISAGGHLRFSREGEQLHYKFILADDKQVLCTSFNLTCFANGNNRENVMIFKDPNFVSGFVSEFDHLVSTLPLQTHVERMHLAQVPAELHGFYHASLKNDREKQVI